MNKTQHSEWLKQPLKLCPLNHTRSIIRSLYVLHFDIWAYILMHRFTCTQSGSNKHSLRLIKRADQLPADRASVHKSHFSSHKHSDDIIKLFPISALENQSLNLLRKYMCMRCDAFLVKCFHGDYREKNTLLAFKKKKKKNFYFTL